ncbi:MAG TPA: (2Fe-2S)-binding protein [Sphingomicrobium sp.]|nr:(2Fe-2S)-binding protein [Sphingomicrobium sp.]
MIVCSCNVIREDEIRAAARSGSKTPQAAYASLGFEPQCGCCLDYAQELIDAERGKRPRLRAVA